MTVANHRATTRAVPGRRVIREKIVQLRLHRLAYDPARAFAHQIAERVVKSWIGK